MRTYIEQKREEFFKKKFTVLLFKLTKNKHSIKGFVNLKGRADTFTHLFDMLNNFKFRNSCLEIFSDFNNLTLEEVKANSDFCIFFNHIGNAKKLDMKLKIHSTDFVEITFFTVNKEMTWEDNRNLWFLDEGVIYDIEYIEVEDGLKGKMTLKPEFKYLFE